MGSGSEALISRLKFKVFGDYNHSTVLGPLTKEADRERQGEGEGVRGRKLTQAFLSLHMPLSTQSDFLANLLT